MYFAMHCNGVVQYRHSVYFKVDRLSVWVITSHQTRAFCISKVLCNQYRCPRCLRVFFWEAELFFFSADGETGDTETDSVQENFDDVNQALIIQNLISVVMSDLYPYASSMRCLWAP